MNEAILSGLSGFLEDGDRVYFLGDVAQHRRDLALLGRLRGSKCLVMGNHDVLDAADYLEVFDALYGSREMPERGILLSHYPVHPRQLRDRYVLNIHGHLHRDCLGQGYLNVCLDIHLRGPAHRYSAAALYGPPAPPWLFDLHAVWQDCPPRPEWA